MLKSYYEILNVTPDATKSEIKIQFKKLVKMYHPDLNSSPEAEQTFKEINKAAEILFAIYPSIRGGYIWQCVTKEAGSYEVRKSVPREWWGATSYELSLMTGAETARFCHPSGFIGGAETFEDTLKMVKIAMES